MDLRQMEYLLAVADEQNFTRAAELSGISQSGLSSAIRSLEAELGTPLFDRTTRRVELTEAGLALLPYARDLLAQAAGARDAVVRAGGQVTGSLRIGAEQCLGFVDVAALLERFHRRHPRVETQFTQTGSQELISLVRSGELDVAFVAGVRHLGSLSHHTLGQESVVLLASADHPVSTGTAVRGPIPWGRLDGQDFIDFAPSWGVRALNDDLLSAQGVRRRVRCTVNDVHTLLSLVAAGLGIAIVPRHVAAKPQAARLQTFALADEPGPVWKVSVVSPAWDRVEAPSAHLLQLVTDMSPAAADQAEREPELTTR